MHGVPEQIPFVISCEVSLVLVEPLILGNFDRHVLNLCFVASMFLEFKFKLAAVGTPDILLAAGALKEAKLDAKGAPLMRE